MCLLQTPDEEAGLSAIVEAFKKGINFYDTAPFYGAGSAERVQIASTLSALLLECLLRLCIVSFAASLQHPLPSK